MKFLLINFYSWLRNHLLIHLIYLLITLSGGQALAQVVIQETEFLNSNPPEAWAMNYVTSITLLAGISVTRSRASGSIEVGAELDWVP